MPADEIAALFGADGPLEWEQHFNIAPSQQAPLALGTESGVRIGTVRWGFHVGDAERGRRQINARSESVHTKAAFRTAFQRRRCAIPASGFFEWRAEGGGKVPYWIQAADGQPLVMAGVWGRDPEVREGGAERRTGEAGFAILTRAAVGPLAQIHARMPSLLGREQWTTWLDRRALPELLAAALATPAIPLTAHPVSTVVNRPANDVPECVTPTGPVLF